LYNLLIGAVLCPYHRNGVLIMESITITRPVTIKVRVTDEYKKLLVSELHKSIKILESEIQHLEFQRKKIKSSKGAVKNHEQIDKQITTEIDVRVQKKQELLNKIKVIGQLENGSEIVHARVESLTELKVGDDWNELMNVEVLIESGKVIQIRSGITGGSIT